MNGIARIRLRPEYEIARVIRGGWQLAGGHGSIDRQTAVEDLMASFDAGLTTFDCADIYTGVEELIGEFRARVERTRGDEAARRIQIHTKLVPDLAALGRIDRTYIEGIVDRSLRRLGVQRLDLVQFHWWSYTAPGLLDVVAWLDEFRRAGKIRHVGLTNFDTAHLKEILAAGVDILSVQTQYSVLDARPAHKLARLCEAHGILVVVLWVRRRRFPVGSLARPARAGSSAGEPLVGQI